MPSQPGCGHAVRASMALNRLMSNPSGGSAGHLSGSDRAARCPTGKVPAVGLIQVGSVGWHTPEQVLKFVPKEKAQNKVAQEDEAGQAIVTQMRTAADLAKGDCDRAMSLAHKLSMELRATEDRTHEMEAEVEHWRERAARAEQWLRTIQNEIEEKLLPRRLFSDAEEVAWVSSGDPLFRH